MKEILSATEATATEVPCPNIDAAKGEAMHASIIRTSSVNSLSPKRGADEFLAAFDDSMDSIRKEGDQPLKYEDFARERGWSDAWTRIVRAYMEGQGIL